MFLCLIESYGFLVSGNGSYYLESLVGSFVGLGSLFYSGFFLNSLGVGFGLFISYYFGFLERF